MEYRELIAAAEANLKAKGILKNYSVDEGIHFRQGTETNHANCSSREYFERLAFKFRLIDSAEASTEITLYGHKFKTPILSAAVSSMGDSKRWLKPGFPRSESSNLFAIRKP